MTTVAVALAILALVVLVIGLRLARAAQASLSEVNTLRTEVAAMRGEFLKMAGASAESTGAIASVMGRLREELQLRVAELNVEFRDHAITLRELVRVHGEQVRAQAAHTAAEISKSGEAAVRIQAQVDELAARLPELRSAISELSVRVTESSDGIHTAVEEQTASLRKTVSELSVRMTESSDRINTAVEGQTASLRNTVSELSVRMTESSDRITAVEEQTAPLRKTVSELSVRVTESSDRINTAVEEQTASLRNSVSELSVRMTESSNRIGTVINDVEGLSSQVRDLQGTSGTLAGKIEETLGLGPKVADCSDRINTAVAAVSDLSSQVVDLQGTSGTLAGKIEETLGLGPKVADCSDRINTALAAVSDLSSQVVDLQGLGPKVADCSDRINTALAAVSGLSSQVGDLEGLGPKVVDCSDRINTALAAVSGLSSQVGDLRTAQTTLTDSMEIMLHTAARSFPIDQHVLRQKTEPEMVALAEAVAIVRPLVPYPKWRFDADWANPDLAFQLRQSIWQYFHDRRSKFPIVIDWYHGSHLALYLGNDLSRQIYIAGCIDPNEFAFLDRFLEPGMTFFDVGANEGIYSVFAARLVGSDGIVWAFEPSKRELRRLKKNIALNDLRVRVFPIALADKTGEADLSVAGYEHEGQNTLGAFVYDIESSGRERVKLGRLDDLVARNPLSRIDVIKADVEGAEIRLFSGATETLRRYRPILLFEASENSLQKQGGSREALLALIQEHDYSVYSFDRHSGLPTPLSAGGYTDNLIAVPGEKKLPDRVVRPWPAVEG